MPSSVVKKETKTYTKRSPDEPGVEIITTETTETMEDGSTLTTVKTTKKGTGLDTFHKETKKALEDSKHGSRRRSSSSSSNEGHGRHHRRHRSRSSSAEKKKGGLLSRFRRSSKSRSPSPKASSKAKKESKSKHRHRSSSSGSSSDDDAHFEEDCIQAHNEYRKKHNVPPLERSRKLTKSAREWAKQLAKDDKMSHRKDSSDGENIYCKWSSNPKHKVKGHEAVESWYAEIKDHNFTCEPTPGVLHSGHFSQVVWLSSRQIGVGKARSKSGRVYVVANYSPAGNFLGDYCDNVPPLGGFPAGFKPKRETARVEKKTKKKNRSASSGSSSDSSSDEEEFAEQCLKAHNVYRRKHGVPALKLNKKLCEYSQEWARTMASKDTMEHRRDKKYGENIFCVWSDDPKFKVGGQEAVDSWYNEIKDHKFGREPEPGVIKSGHFSQVIWKDSKELGIGKARSKSGKIMVVANYDPAGNFIGEFAKNVPEC
ncbi:DNA topoisomerase 1-like isoform X2 [Pollicipes pollicipes]|nr:DNA topoisomerase 1-like isoform X2 [Pollicipes pollicipes]XP_037079766.1 DNA topoisomerase 1-like isoform X2 [Pollicipes pollicipes]XP_037079767.1 DNA topoisomerase 1-like isoform X2 [Pollicipes pollicipes]